MAVHLRRWIAAVFVLAAAMPLCGPARAGSPPPAAASTAYGIYAQFRRDGSTVSFGPLAEIAGRAPPAYDDTVAAGHVHETVPIVAGPLPAPSLFVDAADFTSHVASGGFGVASISAEADAVAKRLTLALMLNPPPVATAAQPIQPAPFLTLTADTIKSTADFTLVVPGTRTAVGSALLGNLVVRGSLVGNQQLRFSGAAGKDTLLYQSPQLTITLNQEIPVGLISCGLVCIFTPSSITTYALDVVLDHADLFGRIVSGEILIGMAHAE